MAAVTSIDYQQDYYQLQPSLFRESENLHLLLQSIHDVFDLQQLDFLWLSENLLNIDIAEKSHLDFIGNIVGQSRFLIDFNSEPYFGFNGAYKSDTFGAYGLDFIGGYWNSRSYFNTPSSRSLSDDEYRRLIKARVIYNNSNCSSDDLLQVINLLSDNTTSTVQMIAHGSIVIRTTDTQGLLSYFVDKVNSADNILPIAAGVGITLDNSLDDGSETGLYRFTAPLEKLVNEDLPSQFNYIPSETYSLLSKLINTDFPNALNPTPKILED